MSDREVYLVYSGEYDDNHPIAAFLDFEQATFAWLNPLTRLVRGVSSSPRRL